MTPEKPPPGGDAGLASTEREAWARAFLETAVDAIITIDAEGRIRSFNPAAERMFGYAAAEAIDLDVNRLMPNPYAREHGGYLRRYLETGNARIIGIGREVTGLRKDGSTFPCHLSVTEVRAGDRRLFAGTVRDLTPLRRAEEDAARSRTLAAIGEMSASVAHEIRNPLAAISGVLQNLRDRLPPADPSRTLIGEALGQVGRLDSKIRELLQFSRSWNPRRKEADLTAIVNRVVASTEGAVLYAGIRFEIQGPPAIPVTVDRTMIEQVFLNLFQNAAEAMDGRGRILCVLDSSASGVDVTVEDDGPGIPPEVQATLFRPFFTTKAGGTGLGLVNCLRMVEAHGGTMSVGDARPHGTRISLRFPRPVEPPAGAPAPPGR